VVTDTPGQAFSCSATSAGGTSTQTVTVKRDATAPVVSATRTPLANADGWNNTDVTAQFSAIDAMSGLATSTASQLLSAEGSGQQASHVFTDNAGNSATAVVAGINIDRTPPVVTVTRAPLPDANGWNDTPVTATWSATDALSGIAGSATATVLFDLDGANQGATRSFTDRAGNSAAAAITGINIDTRPPVLAPQCSATPNAVWPPNNKMVRVLVRVEGEGVTSFRLRSVTNNETGAADVEGWTPGTADLDGFVRAARNGSGTGRVYTLTYDVFGARGATGSCSVTVMVSHNQGGR
jgi:hypothetical protein